MEKLKRCKYCQTEIPKKAKVCPNCKRTLKSHGCLISILIFIGIIIVISVVSVLTSNNRYDKETDSQVMQESTENNERVENDQVQFGTGAAISDELELVVNEVAEADSISAANGMMSYKPDSGKYAVVNVTIKNTSKESQNLLLNYFKLVGPDEAEYVSTIIAVADEKFITIDTINPNLDITGNLVFEIPRDLAATDCVLKYSDYDLMNSIKYFKLK